MREPGRHRLIADSSGVGCPHPALRATFSRGEKGPPEGRLMTASQRDKSLDKILTFTENIDIDI